VVDRAISDTLGSKALGQVRGGRWFHRRQQRLHRRQARFFTLYSRLCQQIGQPAISQQF
jgi:hypothetical protein